MANIKNLRPKPFTSDTGRENQKKSVEARKRNKTIAEATRQILDSSITDRKQLEYIKKSGLPVPDTPTYRDFFVASVLLQTIKKGRVDDIIKLMEVTGETTELLNNQKQLDAMNAFIKAIGGDDAD